MTEIQNNNAQNNNCNYGSYIVIIILLIVIAVLSFFLWKNYNSISNKNITPITNTSNSEDIVVKIIDDGRCSDCQTDTIVQSLKQLPFLTWATFEENDFSDAGIDLFLKANEITKLPAFVLNTNNVPDADFKQYLSETPTGLFNLNIGATYDPYVERSERGFMMLEDGLLEQIKQNSRIYGNENAEILWVEYSDMNCGYCAKLHNDGTHDALFSTFGDKLALAYQYFAIFNKDAPVVLECIAEQKGTDVMYDTIKKAYKEEKKDKAGIAGLVDWINNDTLNACIESGKFNGVIDVHMSIGSGKFGITGTPGNILINTKTGEYAKLPGAYPVSEFEKTINSLLVTK